AWPGQSVKVLDDEGNECTPHELGIVYASGARFSYKGDAAKTEAAWRGDLFTVGDMGYLDDDGYLFLTDRAHDMIITGGANVSPAEVEAVLYQHPGVGDVTVIGIPDDGFGEAVHTIVEPRAPLDPEQLIAFARERLAHYKCPRSVELLEHLPRDDNGKVRKRALRDRYWAGRARKI
ncbi:MAG: acyl-CoA synthetase, partial [Actinomycetota bacterium]